MTLTALSYDRTYIDIIALPCFCRVQPDLPNKDTIGLYIPIEINDRYYCDTNNIYLCTWDAQNNFYIFIKGAAYKTQQKYFEMLSAEQQATKIKGRLFL